MQRKSSFLSTKFIRFLGGKNLLFSLVSLLLLTCLVYMLEKISFIFYPFQVLVQVVILPVVLATILYYLLRPLLRLLEKARIPRAWGIVILFLAVITLITIVILLVVPFLRDQLTNLIKEFPVYFIALINTLKVKLNDSRFIIDFFDQWNFDYQAVINDVTGNLVQTVKETATNLAEGVATGITGILSALTGFVLTLVTVPFILFYLLKDGSKLPKFVLRAFPPRMRDGVDSVMKDMDKQISSYIQGQILVSICIGFMMTIGFLIIGLDYAILLGSIAMVTSVVPYLGPMIAITPAAIIAFVTSPVMLLKLAVVWTVVQLIEGKFISPQIMGKSLSVHPITIIFVLLTSGSLFGAPGVVLGIPSYAIMKVVAMHLFKLYKKRYNRYEKDIEKKYEV